MKHNTSVNNSVNMCMKCFVLSPLMLLADSCPIDNTSHDVTVDDLAVGVAATRVWNSLPPDVHQYVIQTLRGCRPPDFR